MTIRIQITELTRQQLVAGALFDLHSHDRSSAPRTAVIEFRRVLRIRRASQPVRSTMSPKTMISLRDAHSQYQAGNVNTLQHCPHRRDRRAARRIQQGRYGNNGEERLSDDERGASNRRRRLYIRGDSDHKSRCPRLFHDGAPVERPTQCTALRGAGSERWLPKVFEGLIEQSGRLH